MTITEQSLFEYICSFRSNTFTIPLHDYYWIARILEIKKIISIIEHPKIIEIDRSGSPRYSECVASLTGYLPAEFIELKTYWMLSN